MPRTALYPGTFDPITNGHLDILAAALSLADEVVVAIGVHPAKKPMFTLAERRAMIAAAVKDLPDAEGRVRVTTFDGLVIDAARKAGATVIIRGLRDAADFDYEMQMAGMNGAMAPDIHTDLPAGVPREPPHHRHPCPADRRDGRRRLGLRAAGGGAEAEGGTRTVTSLAVSEAAVAPGTARRGKQRNTGFPARKLLALAVLTTPFAASGSAFATETVSCSAADASDALVEMNLSDGMPADLPNWVRVTADGKSWSTLGIDSGMTPVAIYQAFDDGRMLQIDIADEPASKIVIAIRVLFAEEGDTVLRVGYLHVLGEWHPPHPLRLWRRRVNMTRTLTALLAFLALALPLAAQAQTSDPENTLIMTAQDGAPW